MADHKPQEQRTAVAFMVFAIIGFSFVPLIVVLGGGKESPFLLNASWRFGVSLGWILFLVIRYWHLIRNQEIRTLTLHHVRDQKRRLGIHPAIWLLTISYFDYVLLGWSTKFIDISVAAILFETWPLLSVVFLSYLFRREKRFKKLTVETLFLLALGLVGFAFVVVSQVEEIGGIDGITPPTLMLGVALGLGSAIVGALAVYSFKWGFDLATDIEENQLVQKENRESRSSLELFGVVVVCIISTWISSFFSAFAGFFNNETLDFRTVLIGILLGGFTISVASICWRKAISVTSDLGINGMIYLTPVVALIWLGVFSRIDVPYPEYLLIGASGIIIANLLINIEIEVRVGFKSMLIGLWICGLVVYSRGDPIVWEHGYFEILALSATIFTLILSFRVSRMESRTGEEEKEIFAMFRRMELLVESGVLSEELLGNMQDIDSPRNTERLRDVYVKMKREIIEVRANTSNGPNRTELAEVEASLDSIVHSKQQGTEFGELFSLIIFAIITVVIALVAVPD